MNTETKEEPVALIPRVHNENVPSVVVAAIASIEAKIKAREQERAQKIRDDREAAEKAKNDAAHAKHQEVLAKKQAEWDALSPAEQQRRKVMEKLADSKRQSSTKGRELAQANKKTGKKK